MSNLYQDAILAQARSAIGAGRLEPRDGTATVDNPLCGDRVTVDLRMEAGRVSAVGHQVRGCLLCQAAAAAIGARAVGHTPMELSQTGRALRSMLEKGGPAPPGSWPELAAFTPVHGHRSRYECVLLPFEALEAAAASVRKDV